MTVFDLFYEVKCRKCESIITMWSGTTETIEYRNFVSLMEERSTHPTSGCCENETCMGKITVCDVVSYYQKINPKKSAHV